MPLALITTLPYAARIRMDPVKFRVAIPAADPPDDITHAPCVSFDAMCLVADLS
jgi:hypothetical protein